ncbi:MAG: InlB B-repeat-containing protein, partial [Saccharofermentans sp.]|nr:InlB B-repeat-containing protein [Saccharofermentans sp.]
LTQDITAGTGDGPLVVTGTVKLDLNGYVIDRNLKTATSNGGVIFVDDNGNLTINDSRPDATHSPAIKYKDLTTGNDVVVKGGIITGGYNSSGAGAVYFEGASGSINGGTIVGNKACGADVSGNAGGIVIRSSTVTMNGGAVCGNEAVYGDGDTVAGGVMLNDLQGSTTIFNINGGLITGNYTDSADGSCLAGVFTYAGKINISGKPQIYGNEKNGKDNNLVASNTAKGRVVDITGKLNDGARIGVTTWRIPPYRYGPDTFTYGFSTHNPGENPSKYFSLDDETAIMVFDDATEAKVALKFTLNITTDGNGTVTLDPADTDIYYGLYPTLSVTPKTGYVFKEWQVISGKATIDKDNKIFVDAEDPDNPVTDIQIKAIFERKKHNVTFVDGATTLSTVAVVDGEKVTRPSDPVKDGFRFLGWYSDPEFDHPFVFDTAIGKETTIYASFVQEFTVKVTNGTADKTKAIAGETVTVKAGAAPSGSVFDKWTYVTGAVSFADAAAVETSFAMPAGNVEVKAEYRIVSGSCGDDLSWKIDYATGTLTISGTGNMNNWGDTDTVPWYPVRDSIKTVVISDGVTSIGDRAFNGFSNITSVTVPESVTAVGDNAFSGCSNLAEVTYTGTREKWNNISIGSGNDYLANATMQFAKSDNTLSVKGKTAKVKYSKLRRKKQTLSVGKVISFTNRGQGSLTYVKVSGSKKISINKTTGKVTIKKRGLKRRKTYSVKVRVMASGNENYSASTWKYVTFKIKVK